jgi:dTDP-D-glucose 4,6-dehydratase
MLDLLRLYWKSTSRAVINFAADSHAARSFHGLEDFIQPNVAQHRY